MEDDDRLTQIFSSGNKFYIWDQMNDEVFEILSRDFCDIVHILWHGGLRELKRKPLVQVGRIPD